MNPLVTGPNIPTRTPPDKGSFPLDHFQECKRIHDEYMRCLKSNKNDNLSCRDCAKDYLQCRMDKGLMNKESMENLGFSDEDKRLAEERHQQVIARDSAHRKGRVEQGEGFVVAKESLHGPNAWRRPSILGGGTWSLGGGSNS